MNFTSEATMGFIFYWPLWALRPLVKTKLAQGLDIFQSLVSDLDSCRLLNFHWVLDPLVSWIPWATGVKRSSGNAHRFMSYSAYFITTIGFAALNFFIYQEWFAFFLSSGWCVSWDLFLMTNHSSFLRNTSLLSLRPSDNVVDPEI